MLVGLMHRSVAEQVGSALVETILRMQMLQFKLSMAMAISTCRAQSDPMQKSMFVLVARGKEDHGKHTSNRNQRVAYK